MPLSIHFVAGPAGLWRIERFSDRTRRNMKCPGELYLASPRPYHGLPEFIYLIFLRKMHRVKL
jgi:hypothetical protein